METDRRTRLTPDERRAQLVALGVAFLADNPLDELSIEDLSARAGVSRGLLFHYFGSKQGLHREVVRTARDSMLHATEPVADETRSILDGHIVLSRKLAAANHYPAIDVLHSVSRVMDAIVTPEHRAAAGKLRELYAKYNEIELLVQLGEYKAGTDPLADKAIDRIPKIKEFLKQGTRDQASFDEMLARLQEVVQ